MRWLALLLLLTVPATAQVLGDRNNLNCSALTRGRVVDSSIKVICGLSEETVIELLGKAVSGRPGDYSELLSRLEDMTPDDARLKAESLRAFFRTIGQDNVPADELQSQLVSIAQRHIALQDEVARFRGDDPEVLAQIEKASRALTMDEPDHATARQAFAAARKLQREQFVAAQNRMINQARELAGTTRKLAELEAIDLNRKEAARLYEEAASLLPEIDIDQRWTDSRAAALLYFDHARFKGDNDALARSIGLWDRMLLLKPRAMDQNAWAIVQNNLGVALSFMGERAGEADTLERSAVALKQALDVWTPDDASPNWAAAQTNLGTTYLSLGVLTQDSDLLRQAIGTFDRALPVQLRDDVTSDWAATQNNRGTAFRILGILTEDTGQIENAINAFNLALEVWTGKDDPYEWAMAHDSVGLATYDLSRMTNVTAMLPLAVASYERALEIRRPDVVPLDWAATKYNLATALHLLGVHQKNSDHLTRAIASLNDVLGEFGPDDQPLLWVEAQISLGNAHFALGTLTDDPDHFIVAAGAIERGLQRTNGPGAAERYYDAHHKIAEIGLMLFETSSDRTWLQKSRHHLAQIPPESQASDISVLIEAVDSLLAGSDP